MFTEKNQITEFPSCTVVSTLDPLVLFRNDFIVCAKQPD